LSKLPPYCDILCQFDNLFHKILSIIPKKINSEQKHSSKDFTRNRKLPFAALIVFILSLTSSGKNSGVDTKSGISFKNARRSGVWPGAEAVHRSSISKARKKVPWQVFENLLYDATELAYQTFASSPKYLWHEMSVFAFDGSTYNLPATEEIRKEFAPVSGLEYAGRGHYPQCLVSTVYDVFRRFPVARTVESIKNSNERDEAKKLVSHIPPGNLLCFDRGYPSYEFILWLNNHYDGCHLFRCPASNTFPAVEHFVKSGKEEDILWITPSKSYSRQIPVEDRKNLQPIKLRAIRLVSPEGIVSVLLTNLFDMKKFTCDEIISLYFRRWEIENYYCDEKIYLEIEKFHSKSPGGIRQELFAILVMSVITRILMAISMDMDGTAIKDEPQFKNSIMTLASDMAVFVSDDPARSLELYQEIIAEIRRVKYYRSKKPRPTQLRVSKRAVSKWAAGKLKNSRWLKSTTLGLRPGHAFKGVVWELGRANCLLVQTTARKAVTKFPGTWSENTPPFM